jgi:hypothetical protein
MPFRGRRFGNPVAGCSDRETKKAKAPAIRTGAFDSSKSSVNPNGYWGSVNS